MKRALRSALFAFALFLIIGLAAEVVSGQTPRAFAGRAVTAGPGAININATVPVTGAIYLPYIIGGSATSGLSVNVRDKTAVLAFYQAYHETAPAAQTGWTGDRAACNAGTTSASYRQSLEGLVNFFRAMAGVPAQITFLDEYNAKAQQAALMMSVNEQLDHFPPATWKCYTAEGAEAAASSNLSIWYGLGDGYHGIKGQMEDDGPNNYPVGHRRWILCPATQFMGTGDVPENDDFMAANALWVIDDSTAGPRPSVRDDFVAWPPSGYVPDNLVYGRWSFMLRDADFSAAAVRVRYAGNDLPLQILPQQPGACENTLVWVPEIDWDELNPNQDHRFDVEISGVLIDGQTRTFAYDVIVFLVD
jgi:hypothetical protein